MNTKLLKRFPFVLVAMMAMFLIAACDDDSDSDDNGQTGDGTTPTVEASPTQATDDEPSPTSSAGSDASPTQGSTGAATQSPTTGGASGGSGGATITVDAGDAGEIDVRRNGDRVELVEVRPADGWEYREDDDDDDEVEIDFRTQGREMDVDVEIDDGRMKVDIDDNWRDASAGTYVVRSAGEVEFTREGDRLELVEVRPAEGWDHVVDDTDEDEIEVDFRRDRDEVDFEAEIDDGRLNIDIDSEEVLDAG